VGKSWVAWEGRGEWGVTKLKPPKWFRRNLDS